MISRRGLSTLLAGKSGELVREVLQWYRVARASDWRSLDDVRRLFPSADQVGAVLIFDIRHNRYRLIVSAAYPRQRLYVKALLTHKEYERKEWMKWA